MQAANHNAGPKARTTRDASLPQESSESTPCEDCHVREAAGVDPAGRALCQPCARRFQCLIPDGGSRASLTDLSAFQRDVLWTLSHEGASKGKAIMDSLEDYYCENVTHGQLYPNLDALVDHCLVAKGARDRRTNEYELTDAGRAALADRLSWQNTEEL